MHQLNRLCLLAAAALTLSACGPGEPGPDGADRPSGGETLSSLNACRRLVADGFRKVPDDRADRFLGKVEEDTARCRGGQRAVDYQNLGMPWVDWSAYWSAGDASSRNANYDSWIGRIFGWFFDAVHVNPNIRGIDGALIDLEYERVELIKFNLFDNYTYESYVRGDGDQPGSTLRVWDEMRLPPDSPHFEAVGGNGPQKCSGELIRGRTLTGVCNDIFNPRMGSSNTLFARNVEFDETFPDQGLTELTRARHGDRISLMRPDPQVISRKLFTRTQSRPGDCNLGMGLPGEDPAAHCDYQKAPFFNVLAAFWIQFMTHDWFSHLREGNNQLANLQDAGCRFDSDEAANAVGCRRGDKFQPALVAQQQTAPRFTHEGRSYMKRAHRTFENTVTAWWDASQIYGYDDLSLTRVKRDPADRARLLLPAVAGRSSAGDAQGYLPRFAPPCAPTPPEDGPCDNIQSQWGGQETAAFPDNWTIGMSFYHNVFSREHNAFVDTFRAQARQTPDADSGLRNPASPDQTISYAAVTDDELYEAARLVVSAMIAKIHTIEWTTQLLYGEPLYRGMNSNWSGLFDGKSERVERALAKVVQRMSQSDEHAKANSWYSVLAAGPGIFGMGSQRFQGKSPWRPLGGTDDIWSLHNDDHINGGINHFGSPFNFPEEFTTVYRLHPLVPDLLELRRVEQPDAIARKVPAGVAFREGASDILQRDGLSAWGLSMGRQRLGLLHLNNHGTFLQNLPMPHLGSPTGTLDIAALDIIRDRERGVPRFNEFRRQYGLKQLTSFDDFVNPLLEPENPERQRQEQVAATLREVYGQHACDAGKIISHAQRDAAGNYPNDCLGHPDGTLVDNVEDVDTVVGWLAEPVRPHGYAISETQFVVFILNASRRLFSDRFFTSSFRPEFYTALGHRWVLDNGPEPMPEKGKPNGHEQPVSPMKRVLQRTMPELAAELDPVINVFDPWARDRGEFYSLAWKPRPGAENDESFASGTD